MTDPVVDVDAHALVEHRRIHFLVDDTSFQERPNTLVRHDFGLVQKEKARMQLEPRTGLTTIL